MASRIPPQRIAAVPMDPQPVTDPDANGGWVYPPEALGYLKTRTVPKGCWWVDGPGDMLNRFGPSGCIGARLIDGVWCWEIDRHEAAGLLMTGA